MPQTSSSRQPKSVQPKHIRDELVVTGRRHRAHSLAPTGGRLHPPGRVSRCRSGSRSHAEDYRRTKAAMPTPQMFDTLTQRLKMAVAANSTPPTVGLYGPAITALQGQLAEANHTAMTAYQQYRTAALTPSITDPGDNGYGSGGAGSSQGPRSDSAGGDLGTPDGSDAAGVADAAGAVPGTDTLAAGSDPAAAALGGEPGSELLGTVVPALLGGVTGLVGGLVGGLAAAGQGVQQAGTQLVGGLTPGCYLGGECRCSQGECA